jgi:hypothetical protein
LGNLTDEKRVRFKLAPKGVTEQIRSYFLRYPHSNAKQCCGDIGLSHKKYAQMCYNIKSDVKKQLEYKKPNRLKRGRLIRFVHRVEWRPPEALSENVLNAIWSEASKRSLKRGDVLPLGKWYVVANRNRMMKFKNEWIDVRVFPKSGTCRVLQRRSSEWNVVRVNFEYALFEAKLDWRDCEKLSFTLQYPTQSRVFRIGEQVPLFNIDYYKKSLGLIVKADRSHPEHIEFDESYPVWVNQEIYRRERLSAEITRFANELSRHSDVLEKLEQLADKLQENQD